MKKRIVVTQKDIDLGCKKSLTNCPIARAFARATKRDVAVSDVYMGIKTASNAYHSLHTPQIAKEFIEAFDSGLPVKPFQFTIEVPECLLS